MTQQFWDGVDGTRGQRIQATIPCLLTGGRDAVVVATKDRHGNPLRSVISTASGLVYTDPRPDQAWFKQFYRDKYRESYKGSATPVAKHTARAAKVARNRINELAEHIPAGSRVLDLGSGSGEFVYLGGKLGFDTVGVELDAAYAQFARDNYQVEIHSTDAESLALPHESLDCITSFHVLEHIVDPLSLLKSMARFLRPGGIFRLEVPCVETQHSTFRSRWHVGHLYHFNPATFQAMAVRAGLVPTKVWTNEGSRVVHAILTKPEVPHSEPIERILAGNFDRIWPQLDTQATWSGWQVARSLDRFRSRIARTLREKCECYGQTNRRQLVDDIVARASHPGSKAA
ncbi:MAG: class I SAM-dependent methyltransferase [Pirellulaceae bacterium]